MKKVGAWSAEVVSEEEGAPNREWEHQLQMGGGGGGERHRICTLLALSKYMLTHRRRRRGARPL